jgi:hypothetical protein
LSYLYLMICCVAIYFCGFIFNELHGIYWFLGKSSLSALSVLAALKFRCRSNLCNIDISLCVAILESSFILITILASIGYLTHRILWYYDNYIMLLHLATYTELIILILGMPFDKIYRGVLQLGSRRAHSAAVRHVLSINHFENCT